MTYSVQQTPHGAAMMEVRDGRGHLIDEGHVLGADSRRRHSRIVLGNRVLSLGVFRDLIAAELALLANAEELERRRG